MAKRYYWIKLRTDFFDLETIDWLISQPNGCEYVVLYQKLCLLTANRGGELYSTVGEIIVPYDVNKIARDTKFSIDTVIVALELFKKIGLIYEQKNGILKIPYVADIVGSETEYAQKKRDYRDKLKTMSETMSLVLSDKSIDIENIDIKNIETDKDTDKALTSEKSKIKKIPSLELYNKTLYLYNYICLDYPECQLTPGRIAAIQSLMSNSVNSKSIELSDIAECFRLAQKSDFLKGKIEKFKATFDWMLKYENFIKILEHKYNKPEKETSYDVDKFEKFAIGYKPPPRQQLPDFCQNCSCKNEYDCIVSCENPGWSNIVREKFREVLK